MVTRARTLGPQNVRPDRQRIVRREAGRTMSAYAPACSMSKAAVNAFKRIVANAFETAVLVNAVDSDWIRTGIEVQDAPATVGEDHEHEQDPGGP